MLMSWPRKITETAPLYLLVLRVRPEQMDRQVRQVLGAPGEQVRQVLKGLVTQVRQVLLGPQVLLKGAA